MDLPAPIIAKNDYKRVLQMVAWPPHGGLLLSKRLVLEPWKNNGKSFPTTFISPSWRSHCDCNLSCLGLMSAPGREARKEGHCPPKMTRTKMSW